MRRHIQYCKTYQFPSFRKHNNQTRVLRLLSGLSHQQLVCLRVVPKAWLTQYCSRRKSKLVISLLSLWVLTEAAIVGDMIPPTLSSYTYCINVYQQHFFSKKYVTLWFICREFLPTRDSPRAHCLWFSTGVLFLSEHHLLSKACFWSFGEACSTHCRSCNF